MTRMSYYKGGKKAFVPHWLARQDEFSSLASENEDEVIPQLVTDYPHLRTAIKATVSYSSPPLPCSYSAFPNGDGTTIFKFDPSDSFDAARPLVARHGSAKVGVLNMANAHHPGGGYLRGAAAQEEALCRRSTLFAHINFERFYPFSETGGLFSPGVRVFRGNDDQKGRMLDDKDQWEVGVISIAAINGPRITTIDGEATYADPAEEELTLQKIVSLLRIAKLQQQPVLVLGALGCGAFRNPPSQVARLFLHALTALPEFTNVFQEVVFAIIEKGGSDNLRRFKEVWRGVAQV